MQILRHTDHCERSPGFTREVFTTLICGNICADLLIFTTSDKLYLDAVPAAVSSVTPGGESETPAQKVKVRNPKGVAAHTGSATAMWGHSEAAAEVGVDVQLSVSLLRARLGGAIEEAVRVAVETVLCETARLLATGGGCDQEFLQTLKLKPHRGGASTGGDCGAPDADGSDDDDRDLRGSEVISVGIRGVKGHRRGSKTLPPSHAAHEHYYGNRGALLGGPPCLDEEEEEMEEEQDRVVCAGRGGLPDPFDLVSGAAADFGDGPEDWELLNRVYKQEGGVALIDEGGATHYADDCLLNGRDLRIVTVQGDMADPGSVDPCAPLLSPCPSPPEVKRELPETESSPGAELDLTPPPTGQTGPAEAEVTLGACGRLRRWLERVCPEVVREYEGEACLCEVSRRKLVKFSVTFLVEEVGFYPTSAQKTMLAEHIVKLFPSLRLCAPSAGINGIEHLYDPLSRTGYIETRLRNSRRTLEAHEKKYVLKRRRPEPPTQPARSAAPEGRRHPSLPDTPAAIDAEFERLYPGKGRCFRAQWASFVLPRIFQVAERERHPEISALLQQAHTQHGDPYMLTMLKVLIHLLPPASTGRSATPTKCSAKHAIRYLVDIVPTDTKVASLFCAPGSLEPPDPAAQARPYIASLGPLEAPGRRLYLVAPAERVAVPLPPRQGLEGALDRLFKLLRVAGLAPPAQLAALYGFLELLHGVGGAAAAPGAPAGRRTKALELASRLHALP